MAGEKVIRLATVDNRGSELADKLENVIEEWSEENPDVPLFWILGILETLKQNYFLWATMADG